MIQLMLATWSLVPLPFVNPAGTSGSSQFTCYWSLAWRILSIILLACGMSAVVQQFEHSLALPFFEWKLTFSSPMATAEFSKFTGKIECSILTASSFRIWNSSAGVPSPPLGLFIVMHPKAHLTSHSRRSGSRLVITPCGYPGHICIVLLCILVTSSWYLLLLLDLYHFCPLLCPFLHEMFPWFL